MPDSQPGPLQRAAKAAHGPGRVTGARRFEHGGLFDGAAHFTHADGFVEVAHAATEFLLLRGTSGEHYNQRAHPEESHFTSHKFIQVDEPNLRRIRRM